MMFRLNTIMGTFYAESAREIVQLQGLLRGLTHNVSYEANMAVELVNPGYEAVKDEWEIRG